LSKIDLPMAKKRASSESPTTQAETGHRAQSAISAQPSIPAEAALSFLKDSKGVLTWSSRDLAHALNINRREADQVIALLAAQGYVQSAKGTAEWMTTPAGESVSGAKTPRFAAKGVRDAVESLKERIRQVNKDPKAPFKINKAVAFGDFLLNDRSRVQAADVGIALTPRGEVSNEQPSAYSIRAERQFLRQLRGRTALVHLRPFAEWMSTRSHVNLI
jgi:DNA-binding transcriptional MocR family regulator